MKRKLLIVITSLCILLYFFMKKTTIIYYSLKIFKFVIGMNKLQIVMLIFIIAIISIAAVYFKYNKFNLKELVSKNLLQIYFAFFMVSIFNLAAYYSDIVKADKSLTQIWQAVIIWIITLLLSVRLIWRAKKKDKGSIKSIKKTFFEHKFIMLSLMFIIVIRIPMLGSMQRWDAGEYYYGLGTACSKYQFTLASFLKNFRLSQHSNLGFSFIMGIAEFLNPRGISGVLIWNLILTAIAMFCLYELIQKKLLLGCTKLVAATITLAVSCSPIFLGTFAYVNVDYLLALFLIFVIYLEYKQWYVAMFFCTVILSQTKETGVVVVFGYFSYKILKDFLRLKGNIVSRLNSYLRFNYIWVMLFTSVMYALEIIRLGKITTWVQSKDSSSSMGWSSTGINCFGIQFYYIIYKLKQFFILNFTWILVVIVILSMILLIYFKVFLKRNIKLNQYNELFGANIAFLVFSVIYITYTLQRYNIVFELSFVILALCIFYQAFESVIGKKIYCGIIYFLTLLFIGQSFFSIDKISEKQFGTVSTVKSHMTVSSYIIPFNGDGFVTNYQYSWLDRAFNKLLQTIHYNSEKQVLLTSRQKSGTQINGNGKLYRVGYDTLKKKRIIIEKKNNEDKINTIASYKIFSRLPYKYYRWETNSKINDYAVMFFIPYYEENIYNELAPYQNYCYTTDTENVETFGGNLYYNELIKKDTYTSASILDLKNADNNNTKNKISLEKLVNEELLKSDWTANNIDNYYNNNLLLNYEKSTQSAERDIIQKGDIINMNIEVYDDKGTKLDTRYIGNYKTNIYKNVIVGENILMDDIYNKLIGAKLQKTYKVVSKVPENYENLLELKEKKLTFLITPLEITGYANYNQVSDEDKKSIFVTTSNDMWTIISKEIKRNILCNTIDSDYDYNMDEITKQKEYIEQYFNKYWKNNQISKEKYLNDFIKCSDGEFEELKEELAKSAIRETQLDKILQAYKKYWENLDFGNDYSTANIKNILMESYEFFKE